MDANAVHRNVGDKSIRKLVAQRRASTQPDDLFDSCRESLTDAHE
jgi:hypothetical protein